MKRIQIELPEERADELDRLKKISMTNTTKELLNNSLTMMDWAINEVSNGRFIASVDERDQSSIKELEMPIFFNVRKRSKE